MMGANIPILPLRMPIPPGPVCSWRYLSALAGSVTFPGTTIILSNRATSTNCWCGTGDNGTRWDGRCPTPMDSIMREFLPDTSTGGGISPRVWKNGYLRTNRENRCGGRKFVRFLHLKKFLLHSFSFVHTIFNLT